jgi:hypothetical protein
MIVRYNYNYLFLNNYIMPLTQTPTPSSKSPSIITGIGISVIALFSIPKILNFYGITIETYGPYLAFFIFIVLSSFILPRNFTNILKPEDSQTTGSV